MTEIVCPIERFFVWNKIAGCNLHVHIGITISPDRLASLV